MNKTGAGSVPIERTVYGRYSEVRAECLWMGHQGGLRLKDK